jgi:hypothetical protein
MSGTSTQWDPNEWQRRINQLLFARYGHAEYQRVPDKHGGDFGIEGFSRDGCAYQCYAAEEPISTGDLHDKQRDKIHEDLKKFTNNSKALASLFAGVKIKRWILVVPRFESAKLLEYCGPKTDHVRSLNLPYVDTDFAVHVCTDEAWAREAAQLALDRLVEVSLQLPVPNREHVQVWENANANQMATLRRKAAFLTTNQSIERFVQGSVRAHIKGQNAYERLRTDMPEVCEALLLVKDAIEEQLERECAIAGDRPRVRYRDVQNLVAERLREKLNLSSQLLAELSAEAVSDWLIRCPLDFYEDDDGSS